MQFNIDLITFIHVIIITIVITNLDNMIIMLTFSSLPQFKRFFVGLGYFLAMIIILILVYVLGFLASKVVPLVYVHYLGILPIVFGIYSLGKVFYDMRFSHHEVMAEVKTLSSWQQLSLNTFTHLACAIDSLVVFIPILLKHKGDLPDIIFLITFAMTIAVISVVITMSGGFINLNLIKRFGAYAMPIILILVGIYILYF